MICRRCLSENGGDGIAAVRWIRGCDFPEALQFVCEYLRLQPPESPSNGRGQGKRRIVATYDYRDAAGNRQYQAVRYEPKGFAQRRPKPGGDWEWKTKGIEPLPYRLPELRAADSGHWVFMVEGEKDADGAM